MTEEPENDLESQRAAIAQAFRYGWRSPQAGKAPGPFITNVTDAGVIMTGAGAGRRVAVLFSHEHFPGIRFGHRFWREPGPGTIAGIELKEEIETGALHRIMQNPPAPDGAGVIWTTWGD